ncbi:hypothetical protein [Streptomyces sp. NBC_00572]|uniref:hypothetical protein n=1 Tax=Streptomyces sp. NBC_00572 TaxID=2903664 RepID=UPI00224FDC75|nr:hypothetical protein [Streptomyces sp. NBC_00572]MCX4982624.1 hypothetical protein [Streptomyces sp. NBC_00572]
MTTLIRRTVRTTARAFLALPVGLAAVALALTGQPGRAARVRARLTDGDGEGDGGEGVKGGWTGGRVLGRAVLGLPLDTAAFVLVGYALFNSVRNFGYPIWYLDTDYHQAWGGPTMAGVWAVHAGGWLLVLAVLLHWPVRWLARGQRALDRRIGAGARP